MICLSRDFSLIIVTTFVTADEKKDNVPIYIIFHQRPSAVYFDQKMGASHVLVKLFGLI